MVDVGGSVLSSAPLDHICTMVSMMVEAPKMQKKWNVGEGSKRNNKRNCSHLIFVWRCFQFWFCFPIIEWMNEAKQTNRQSDGVSHSFDLLLIVFCVPSHWFFSSFTCLAHPEDIAEMDHQSVAIWFVCELNIIQQLIVWPCQKKMGTSNHFFRHHQDQEDGGFLCDADSEECG